MRFHTTTVLTLSAFAVLALVSCSASSTSSTGSAAAATAASENASAPAPLSSAALSKRLLSQSDLGEGYTRAPQRPTAHDDVTVIGCPVLEQLGATAATGVELDFSRKAEVSFTYVGGSDSELAEELYSDTAAKLSESIGEIFDAMVFCPTYQVVSGSTVIDVGTHATAAPALGDERWSQLLTFSVGGQSSVVKQTAVRTGNVLVIVSGSPGLVDAHLEKALAKAKAAH
ncbi:hypothetical protein [Streptomyces sp. AS02]|uniref:hypothetical protein n=1 Tax=Streptomyces sp. AS02 TaxID=2938946 RepID=UPI0020205C67|nr:hypothetical protein [Streptomyces sp. AS02]MCL8015186.1 hypothetical protein [Streptomyces sp. AS02]